MQFKRRVSHVDHDSFNEDVVLSFQNIMHFAQQMNFIRFWWTCFVLHGASTGVLATTKALLASIVLSVKVTSVG